jgi:hypothetical protein
MKGMRMRLRETGQLPQPYASLWNMNPRQLNKTTATKSTYEPVTQITEEVKSYDRPYSNTSYPGSDPNPDPVAPLGEFNNPYSSAPYPPLDPAQERKAEMERRRYGHSAALIYLAMFLALLSFLMWVISVTHMIMGWSWPSGTHSRTLAYLQDPRTWNVPALIANMPASCSAWLTSVGANGLAHGGIFNADTETYVSNLLNTAIMTVFTKYCAFVHLSMVMPSKGEPPSSEVRINRVLRIYAYGVTGIMAFATVATAIYVGVERSQKKQDHIRYTNNATTTGGCSFAVVQAEKTWGYLDIAENLPLRLALATLGL